VRLTEEMPSDVGVHGCQHVIEQDPVIEAHYIEIVKLIETLHNSQIGSCIYSSCW
jgi:hypothetical protein